MILWWNWCSVCNWMQVRFILQISQLYSCRRMDEVGHHLAHILVTILQVQLSVSTIWLAGVRLQMATKIPAIWLSCRIPVSCSALLTLSVSYLRPIFIFLCTFFVDARFLNIIYRDKRDDCALFVIWNQFNIWSQLETQLILRTSELSRYQHHFSICTGVNFK